MRYDREWLQDILEAIESIQANVPHDKHAFENDRMILVWSVYHLQIVGEAARVVTSQLREQHPEVPWSELIAMRNILAHQYFRIDPDEVWNTIQQDLPLVAERIRAILRGMEETETW